MSSPSHRDEMRIKEGVPRFWRMNRAVLFLIVGLFILLIGGGVWKRTHMSVAPPIWDPISYYTRIELVWRALYRGDFHGILNGPMAIRPPGTAFVLYPFGFKASIHSFLFRSVFAPIFIWAIALSVPIVSKVRHRSDAILGSALIIGLSCMPLFYQFELNEVFTNAYMVSNQWGMVDALEGSVAALATGYLCYGISSRSVKWCLIGWFFGAFSFFIKPSGLLVMMALGGIASADLLIQFINDRFDRRAVLKFATPVYLAGLLVFGVALWLAFSSEYMSREVVAQAVKASQILLALYQGQGLPAMLALFVGPVLGWWWFCLGLLFVVLLGVEGVRAIGGRRWSPLIVKFGAAGAILLGAVCWWIFLAGQQHRYLFPFLLMVIVWFIPEIFQRAREFRISAKAALIGYCSAPAVLLVGLIWSNQPSIKFQQLIGVNLSSGAFSAEVEQGKWLLAESKKLNRAVNLYSLGNYGVGVVEMVDWIKSIEKNNAPHRFIVRRPLNWVDTPGLRVAELFQSDFLLLENVRPKSRIEAPAISTWSEEVESFKQFAYTERGLGKNGLELISDGSVKLLRVSDLQRFREALYEWANSIHWGDDFRERNKAFLQDPTK